MIFTLQSKFQGFGSPKVTMEFEVDQLEDVLTYFEQFLRGSGYTIDGMIDVVPHEEETRQQEFDMDGRC